MGLPPAVAAVRRGVRRSLAGREPGSAVVVACSGGADSLALLSATIFEGHRAGLRVIGATVDHGLQDGSAEHAARVVQQMAGLGTDETATARVQVDPAGTGPEDAARRARYAVLEQLRTHLGAEVVLLGHTRDDQAETVLLGLTRGSGARSLAGMRRTFDHYERPLLDVTRAQTEAACAAEGIEFWDDPHNSDPGFTRVRVRRTVLPLLEEQLGPGVAATLARTADQVRDDVAALDALAAEAFAELRVSTGSTDLGPDSSDLRPGSSDLRPGSSDLRPGSSDLRPGSSDLRVVELVETPRAIASRVLRLAALEAGAIDAELFHVHVAALLDLAEGALSGEVQLPGHVSAYRREGILRFRSTLPG